TTTYPSTLASRDNTLDLLYHSPSLNPYLSHIIDPISHDLFIQIASGQLYSARGLRYVPVILLQLAEDIGGLGLLLEYLEGCGAQPRRLSSRCARSFRRSRIRPPDQALDIPLCHRSAGRENQQPFDGVLELADIARPLV